MGRSSAEEEKETCWQLKRLKTSEVNKDFISDLPDPILVHILSFLPLKDAIKTVLLRRFGKLWLSMPVLDLDNCAYHDYSDDEDFEICDYEKFMGVIHQIWSHHDNNTLDKLHLKFPFALAFSKNEPAFVPNNEDYEKWEKEKAAADQIEKLVVYAISREVKALDLNFKGCETLLPPLPQFYKLPSIFKSNYITDLRLAACDIRSCGTINLHALRVLCLNEVLLSDETMAEILGGCPILEDLSVVDCYGLGELNCENPNLKKLMLTLTERRSLFVSCPHAKSLEVSGLIERAYLLNVSSLVEASIYFSYLFKCEQRVYLNVSRLLTKVRQSKTFTTCSWTILVLSIWKLRDSLCPYFKWKNIKLKVGLTKWHLPGLSFLLKASRCLETLTMYIYRSGDSFFQSEDAKWIWEYDFDGENYWDSQEATFNCLESIVIYGEVNQPYVIQMVKFLLKNAPKLQKMVISNKKSLDPSVTEGQNELLTSDQLLELSQKLLTFPRASSQAMVYFS